jgi:hypothetical protein
MPSIIAQLQDMQTPALGFIVFWNVKELSITRDGLAERLIAFGLPSAYAKDHNYRSAYIRALRTMEEKRIIRKVDEDSSRIVYQFTAEARVDGDIPGLEYHEETKVVIDKIIYQKTEDFGAALTCNQTFRDRIISAFNEARSTYNSADVTRCIQKIFSGAADIVSLRPQGSIYFVPAIYKDIVDKVRSLAESIGFQFSRVPIPDVSSSRAMVGDAFSDEVAQILADMEKDIEKARTGDGVSDQWVEHRQDVVSKVKKRIDMYSEVLSERAGELSGKFDSLVSRVLQVRKLSI